MNQTEQICKIMEFFYSEPIAYTVGEIARNTGIDEQTTRRKLVELKGCGWVDCIRDDDKTRLWSITDKVHMAENQAVLKRAKRLIGLAGDMLNRIANPETSIVSTWPAEDAIGSMAGKLDEGVTYTHTVRCDKCGMADFPEGETCPNCDGPATVEEGVGRKKF